MPYSAEYYVVSLDRNTWHNDVPLILKMSCFRAATLREVLCALAALPRLVSRYPIINVFGSPRLSGEEERPFIEESGTTVRIGTIERPFWLEPETHHIIVANAATQTY